MKKIYRILDDLSPSNQKLRNLPRKPDGLHNMHFNEYGQLEKRKGYTKHNTNVIDSGSNKIVGMHRFYKMDTSDKEFLVAWKTSIYQLPDDGGTAVALTGCPTLVANSDTYFCDFLNHCYFLNGVDGVFKYDLDNVRTITPAVPDAKPDESVVGSGGSLGIGEYKFCYTYVDENGYEGNPSAVSDTATTTVANSSVTVTIVNSTDEKITKRRVYRTAVGGAIYYYDGNVEFLLSTGWTSTGWTGSFSAGWTHTTGNVTALSQSKAAVDTTPYFITYTVTGRTAGTFVITFGGKTSAAISASGVWEPTASSTANLVITPSTDFDGKIVISINDTTFTSIRADGTLGSIVKTNHNAPPTTSHLITKRRNKLYLAYFNYLYPSYTSDVEYFPPLWRLRTGNSQKITGLLEQLTALPVITDDSIERLVGTDEDNFEFKNSYSTEGNIALRSLVNCDNFLVYLGFNGINYFDGVSSGIFSKELNKYIRTYMNYTYAHLSCATYWDDKYLLSYPTNASHPEGASEVPNETIYYDLKTKTYGIYSYSFSCYALWNRGNDGLRLFGGSNTEGRVYELTGTDDDGSAITCYDNPEPIDLGMPDIWKQWYNIYIKVKSTTGTALGMYYTLDGETPAKNMISRTDIAFVDGGGSADTITTVAGDFVAAGFAAEDVLVVVDTDNNNKNMTIVSVVAKTITLDMNIVTTETAGKATLIKALTLTADTTKWYKIDLGGGGQRARALKPRPCVSDKYDVTFMGYAFVFDTEAPEY